MIKEKREDNIKVSVRKEEKSEETTDEAKQNCRNWISYTDRSKGTPTEGASMDSNMIKVGVDKLSIG